MQRRVTAYTAAGIQCCLPGLGDDLTFPSTWSVQSALNGGLWVRFATEDEKKASGKWWHLLEFEPKAILHSNGTHAFDREQLGDYGDRVTVLAQRRVFQSPGSCPPEGVAASEPTIDLSLVPTPPTPPPKYLRGQGWRGRGGSVRKF